MKSGLLLLILLLPYTSHALLPSKEPCKSVFQSDGGLRVSKTNFPYPEYIGERLVNEGRVYQLTNIGSRPQFADQPFFEAAYQDYLSHKNEGGFQMLTPEAVGAKARADKWLSSLREAVGQKIYDTYKKRKKYLTDKDLLTLKMSDISAQTRDTDYFVLLNGKNLNTDMTVQEFQKRAVMSLQIVYSQYQMPMFPDILMKNFNKKTAPIPHQQRAKDLEYPATQKLNPTVAAFVAGRTFVELTRFGKYEEVNNPVASRFILNALKRIQSIISDGVILISVDSKTKRLFSRYNFKVISEHVTDNSIEPEYIMALEVGSGAFQDIIQKLEMDSAGVSN